MTLAAGTGLAPQRPWKRALAWLAFLGPFFFATYGLANWMASRHDFVSSIVFGWEREVPFLPWTIVPYWSVDALYGLSLFVCANARELDTHAKRLLCAQVVSVACFLLFPLSFSFARPSTDGVPGLLFDVLAGFDKPFNQAPSLHIALLVILWTSYARHAEGGWRWLLHVWFVIIGASVLTTYQHHFIDLPTGAWVGWLCIWLFPEEGKSLLARASLTTDPRRRTLALRYMLAGILFAAVAAALGGWGLWLLWPAGSLALIAATYALLDETAFQKGPDGALSAAVWWLLAPYLAGAWLNSRWWTRKLSRVNAVVPGLLIGRLATRADCDTHGVRAVVDLTAELPCPAAGMRYASVPQLDLVSPSSAQLGRAARTIEAFIGTGPVLVCCALGLSRSAMAVAAWLIASGRAADHLEALALVRRARPAAVLNEAHERALESFSREEKGR
jgi:protein-tyrosine phosphatase